MTTTTSRYTTVCAHTVNLLSTDYKGKKSKEKRTKKEERRKKRRHEIIR